MLCCCLTVYLAGWLRGGRLSRNSATPAAGAQSFYEVGCWYVSLGRHGKLMNVDLHGIFVKSVFFSGQTLATPTGCLVRLFRVAQPRHRPNGVDDAPCHA